MKNKHGGRSLTQEEIKVRAMQLRAAEFQMPRRYFYLSFATPSAKPGTGFRGGVIIEAHGIVTALDRVNLLGINPGGEVMCVPCNGPVLPELCERLLDREELEYAFGKVKRISSQ